MTCEETTPLLMDRLQGALAPPDDERLRAHLATCAACSAEAAALTETWDKLGRSDDNVPHERLRARFHAALAAYEANASRDWLQRSLERWWPKQPLMQMAIAAAFGFIGVLVGQQLPSTVDAEVAALREEVRGVGLALLDHQSAAQRLLGIEWSRRTAQTPEVVDALLERVQYDPNVSVRLAAVDALRPQLERPGVVSGLAAALTRQESPLLQVALTEALLAVGADTAVDAVRAFLARDDLDPSVRDYLEMALSDAGLDTPPSSTGV